MVIANHAQRQKSPDSSGLNTREIHTALSRVPGAAEDKLVQQKLKDWNAICLKIYGDMYDVILQYVELLLSHGWEEPLPDRIDHMEQIYQPLLWQSGGLISVCYLIVQLTNITNNVLGLVFSAVCLSDTCTGGQFRRSRELPRTAWFSYTIWERLGDSEIITSLISRRVYGRVKSLMGSAEDQQS